MSDYNLVSYRKNINRTLGRRNDGILLDYNEAERVIVDYITNKRLDQINSEKEKEDVKTKEDLRREMYTVRKYVTDCILENNMSIRGYQGEKIERFIEDMVQEYAGYSILDDAFKDDEISDIYCIDWETIFVEKKGKNVRYWKKFRSPEHYKNVVERFIRSSGKEINNGENKIVDFELYQDRGCATCPVVSPRDYSLTMRKHAEDHIILDQLTEWDCFSEEMSQFLGMVINGEANLIYAGLTGSGKTTTIRALLDYYVTKNGKRMLVCEDTQELFPKNEHTLELVSVKGDKPTTSVSLSALIVTALRLKPKYIIVGEVRAEEAMAAVEGMETGHSTIFTMHGGTPMNIVNRLVTKYLMAMPSLGIDVVERIIGSAVDYIAIQDNIPGIGRKISIISEVDYDFNNGRVTIKPIFKFDFEINDFKLINRISQDKADKMMRRGIPIDEIRPWINTGDPEVEEKFIKEFNDRYFREKPARMEAYKARKEAREAAKSEAPVGMSEEEKLKNEQLVKKVIINESQKESKKDSLLKQIDSLAGNNVEEDKNQESTEDNSTNNDE
jgi:pilus assembly protein CpaF